MCKYWETKGKWTIAIELTRRNIFFGVLETNGFESKGLYWEFGHC